MMRPREIGGGLRIAQMIESDGPGGAEQVVVHLALALHNAGAHSVVFVPSDGEGWLARQLYGSGVAIEHFRVDRPVSSSCARTLTDGLRRHSIDVVHSHEFSMAVYGAWASWRTSIPHVITMHGSTYYARRLRRRLALRAAIGTSGLTVAVSNQLADTISRDLRVPRSKLRMVPNGVRCESARNPTLRAELDLTPTDRLLVSVGNLYPVKGHQYLIAAMALIRAAHPSVHLAIAGRGDRADALLSQARELGVADRIHLLGLRSDISSILADADIFVMPSLSEGLPLALLEAMVAGCPIIASDVGEIGDALGQGECGVLVTAGNAAHLASALDRLLRDRTRATELGRRASARARAEYDVASMVLRYVDGYTKLSRPLCS
jgi:glycosyltransferase involved in cell wall biosynthesis